MVASTFYLPPERMAAVRGEIVLMISQMIMEMSTSVSQEARNDSVMPVNDSSPKIEM